MILLPEGSAEARRSSPRSLTLGAQSLWAPALQPPSEGSPGSRSGAVRAGLPLPSCGTLGTWASVSGPQLPLPHNEDDNRPHFTGLQGGSREVPGRRPLLSLAPLPLAHLRVRGALSPPLRRPLSGAPPLTPSLGPCSSWASGTLGPTLGPCHRLLSFCLSSWLHQQEHPALSLAQRALLKKPWTHSSTHHPAIQQACLERPCSARPEQHGGAHAQGSALLRLRLEQRRRRQTVPVACG